MSDGITFVGLDVHKNSIQVALLPPDGAKPVEWQEVHTTESLRRLSRRLLREAAGEIRCCYEAGPTGYGVQRRLTAAGIPCLVAAPSLIPIRPGARVKTDRRDALKLAELLRAGLLTEVQPPNERDEALRDLCRCRDDVRLDLARSRHRLSKFLLRRQCVFRESKHHWGTRHMAWLRRLQFEEAVTQAVLDSYMLTVEHLTERQQQLELQMGEFGGLRTVWRASSLVAMLPRHRHGDRGQRRGRAARVRALPVSPWAHGVSRAHPERALQRRNRAARLDHQSRQSTRPQAAGRGSVAPPSSASGVSTATQASGRTTCVGNRSCRPCAGATPPTLRTDDGAREAPRQGDRRHGSGARRTSLGCALQARLQADRARVD